MPLSRAELIASDVIHQWRRLSSISGLPTPETIVQARESILGLVAENLLAEILCGLVVGDTGFEVALHWHFGHAMPPLHPYWPLTILRGDARFVLRLRLDDSWRRLSAPTRRAIAKSLPIDLLPPDQGLGITTRLIPISAKRLPEGDFLIMDSMIRPPLARGR